LLYWKESAGTAPAQKIGVLPFEDAAGVGPAFGGQVAKFIRSEFLQNKKFLPKFIQYTPGPDESASIDVEKAVALGKKNGVDYVVIGTILEAEATSFQRILDDIRYTVARELLTVTDLPIGDIAETLAYSAHAPFDDDIPTR